MLTKRLPFGGRPPPRFFVGRNTSRRVYAENVTSSKEFPVALSSGNERERS
jgi:hypothetical protein